MIEIREKLALRNKLKGEEHLEIYGEWGKRSDRNENVFAQLNRLRENAEIVICCRGPVPAGKKQVYQ